MISARLEAPSAVAVDQVVAADESSRTPVIVEEIELGAAPTFAADNVIRFAGAAKVVSDRVLRSVLPTRQDFKVLGPVVELVAIAMVDDLTPTQLPTENLGRNEAVLVDVPPRICHRMASELEQRVAVARDCPATTPVGIARSRQNDAHTYSVASRLEQANDQN